MTGTWSGAYGSAQELPVPDNAEASETVCHWLITAPAYHPLWSQYVLAVVRLRDIDGRPPIHWQFTGATHEYLLVALDPGKGRQDAATMAAFGNPASPEFGHLPRLTPTNLAIQFEGTDDEMRELASLGARSVVEGLLDPETANGPERIRAQWKSSLVKTLAHIRGEVHAS